MIQLKPFLLTNNKFEIFADLQIERSVDQLFISVEFSFSQLLVDNIKWVSEGLNPIHLLRKDEIWKSTCVEFFLKPENQTSYLEFNINDKGEWNLYFFESYRNPNPPTPIKSVYADSFEVLRQEGKVKTKLSLDLKENEFQFMRKSQNFEIGLTAITELKNGEKIFWAIDHTSHKPDFHQEKSFQLNRTI